MSRNAWRPRTWKPSSAHTCAGGTSVTVYRRLSVGASRLGLAPASAAPAGAGCRVKSGTASSGMGPGKLLLPAVVRPRHEWTNKDDHREGKWPTLRRLRGKGSGQGCCVWVGQVMMAGCGRLCAPFAPPGSRKSFGMPLGSISNDALRRPEPVGCIPALDRKDTFMTPVPYGRRWVERPAFRQMCRTWCSD